MKHILLIGFVSAAWKKWEDGKICDPDTLTSLGTQKTIKPTYNEDECAGYCKKLLIFETGTGQYCCNFQVIVIPPTFLDEDPTNQALCIIYQGNAQVDKEKENEEDTNKSFTFKNGDQLVEEDSASQLKASLFSIIILGLI